MISDVLEEETDEEGEEDDLEGTKTALLPERNVSQVGMMICWLWNWSKQEKEEKGREGSRNSCLGDSGLSIECS